MACRSGEDESESGGPQLPGRLRPCEAALREGGNSPEGIVGQEILVYWIVGWFTTGGQQLYVCRQAGGYALAKGACSWKGRQLWLVLAEGGAVLAQAVKAASALTAGTLCKGNKPQHRAASA